MKKVISLISSLALVISLSSCAIKETPIINGVEYKYNDQFYADTVDQLLTYIDDGEDLVGVYNISINTLDYESGDIECNTANTIEIADHNCCVVSCYGDSSSYIVAQTGNKYEVIDIYRIINPQSIVKYDDITAWNSIDFQSFKEKFGAPYAESLDNDKEHVLADVYMYKISDSNKYAIVAVGRDDGSINALSVKDIDSRWSEENKYEYILENE